MALAIRVQDSNEPFGLPQFGAAAERVTPGVHRPWMALAPLETDFRSPGR